MAIIGYFVGRTLYIILDALTLIMLIHAIMSWLRPGDGGGRIMIFIDNVVELLVSPVRQLLSRFELVRQSPIDLSFTATWLLLLILSAIVGGALM